jgi:hypothetical protein
MDHEPGQAAGIFSALCANEPELEGLRASIHEFLHADREQYGWRPAVDSWLSCWDEEFSARLGGAGFLGLTIPAWWQRWPSPRRLTTDSPVLKRITPSPSPRLRWAASPVPWPPLRTNCMALSV